MKVDKKEVVYDKFKQSHIELIRDAKTGETYSAGVALATAKK